MISITVLNEGARSFLCRIFGHWMKWNANQGNVAHVTGRCRLCARTEAHDVVWPRPA